MTTRSLLICGLSFLAESNLVLELLKLKEYVKNMRSYNLLCKIILLVINLSKLFASGMTVEYEFI